MTTLQGATYVPASVRNQSTDFDDQGMDSEVVEFRKAFLAEPLEDYRHKIKLLADDLASMLSTLPREQADDILADLAGKIASTCAAQILRERFYPDVEMNLRGVTELAQSILRQRAQGLSDVRTREIRTVRESSPA